MRQPFLGFGLVSTASAVVCEAIDFPLSAMIAPIFAGGIQAYLMRQSPHQGVDATDFAIKLTGVDLGSQVTPGFLNRAESWPMSLLPLVPMVILILFTLGHLNRRLLGMAMLIPLSVYYWRRS